jgi:hypothetical protein
MNPNDIDLPFEDLLAECTALLERLDVLLGATEPLEPDEIRRASRAPHNGEAIVRELAAQCRENAVTHAGHITVDDMTRGFDRALAIRRILEKADLVRARLYASRLRVEGESWKSALTFYALLRSLAQHDASMEVGVSAVSAFFRRRKRRAYGS